MSQEQLRMANNVALVRRLADGGACFCTRDAMQGYDVVLFIIALAKTVTPGGSPLTVPSGAGRTADHLAVLFSQKILAVWRGNDIYRPVRQRIYSMLIC
jgi:hypothetical protein